MLDSILKKGLEMKIKERGIDWIQVQSVSLHSADNRAEATIQLDGDSSPVQIDAEYRIEGENLVIGKMKTSKRWMTEVAELALLKTGRTFPMPRGFKGIILKALL